MNEFDRLLDEAFPAATVSNDLRRRVADLPRTAPKPPLFARPLWLATGGLAAVALSVALALPRDASAQALIAKAGAGFTGHSRTFALDAKGVRKLVDKTWFAKDKKRIENPDPRIRSVLVINAERGFLFYWSKPAGTFQLQKRAIGASGPDVPTTLDPKALAELVKDANRGPVPPLVDATLDGRKVKKVELRRGRADLVLYGEPGTLKLIAYEAIGTRYRGQPFHELTYLEPGTPSPERFEPIVELNGRRFNVFDERARVEKSLAKPLARYPVPGGTVDIRNVTMNRHKDLFVLYTALNLGQGYDYLPGTITDDKGGVYVRGIGLRPYQPGGTNRLPGFAFNGKPLEGAWYARLGTGTPSKVTIAFRNQNEPGWPLGFRHSQPIRPQPVEVPDFMPFMALGMGTPEMLDSGRAFALTLHYERLKQWPQMEHWARRNAVLTDAQPHGVNEYLHMLLAKALTMQGKKAEALREIAKTRRIADPTSGNSVQKTLRDLERRLAP